MLNKFFLIFLCSAFICAGCASTDVYKQVLTEETSDNVRTFEGTEENVYNALIKTFFLKSFMIEQEDREKGIMLAKRSFKKGKRTVILALQARLMPETDGRITVFLNAVQTTERLYVADRTRFFMFIVPLPGGGGKQASSVKEGEKIVRDKDFYQQLFETIGRVIIKGREFPESAQDAFEETSPDVLEEAPQVRPEYMIEETPSDIPEETPPVPLEDSLRKPPQDMPEEQNENHVKDGPV